MVRARAAVELRLEGSEELGYDPLGSPPKGEICLRGPMVFAGYYKDPEKTKEAFGARPGAPEYPSLSTSRDCRAVVGGGATAGQW